jgi:hypothetical protein
MASELTVQTLRGPTSGANADTVLIPSSQTLHAPGHVIQVVQSTGTNGSIFTSSAAYVTTPYTGSITPKFATSKILVTIAFSVLLRATGSDNSAALGFSLKRGSTRVTTSPSNTHEMFISGSGILSASRQSFVYLDSPNTASSTTYALDAWPRYTGQTTEFDSRNSTWSVTLQEIAQ